MTAFQLTHVTDAKLSAACPKNVEALLAWRRLLFQLQLIGCREDKYDGVGYGNLSVRQPPFGQPRKRRRFIITGTQTGHLARLTPNHLSLVKTYCPLTNHVLSTGPMRPSSEAMTHGAVYDLTPTIRAVFHVHSPAIWSLRHQLKLPTTDPNIEYGTPEMADAVNVMARQTPMLDKGAFAMGGHEDGLVTFGQTVEEAGSRLICILAQAYASIP